MVVIGGGDVAFDAGRTAFRCGAESVHLACIEDERTLPASSEELEEGREERVHVEYGLMPVEILGAHGEATGVRFQRCTLGEPNERGWRPPLAIDGEFVEIQADTVIFAIGQALVDDFLRGADGVTVEKGQVAVDPDTMMTGRPAVFAGGDAAAMGPWTAIEAIAAGRRAARAIHNFLRGEQMVAVWDSVLDKAKIPQTELAPLEPQARRIMKTLDGVARRTTWHEVRLGFTKRTRSPRRALPGLRRLLGLPLVRRGLPRRRHRFRAEAPAKKRSPSARSSSPRATRSSTPRASCPWASDGYDNVLTQSQLARLLSASGPTGGELVRPSDGSVPKKIFMLQCVGSRDCTSTGNEHCSAICCLFATLHSSLIMQHLPDAEVTIGYTDLRAPGKAHEEYYRLVQSRGVRYVRGRIAEVVEEPDKSLRVRLEDTVTGRKTDELFDLVVLSAGLEASDGTTDIARVAGLQQGAAGFIKEYHPKLKPVDTQRPGIFVAGTAQGPKSIPDSIAQAKAAAARVMAMLSTGFVLTPAQVASSDEAACIGCGVCETRLPAERGRARRRGRRDAHAVVEVNACRGCGICAAECPSGAMTLGGFSDDEILAEVMV